jgi:hypothetical protein
MNRDDLSVGVVNSTADIELLRTAWESMQWHPNADIDFFITINQCRVEILSPHILVLRQDENVKAMLIGRIEEVTLEFHFGYKTIFKEKLRQLNLIHGGNLGDLSSDNERLLFNELMNDLKTGYVDAIFFDHIDIRSELYNLARSVPAYYLRDTLPLINSRCQMDLPYSLETFLKGMGSKHRYWLRRLERVLFHDFPQEVRYGFYSQLNDVSRLCSDVETVAKKTYQRALGAGFQDNMENRARIELEAKKGWLRAYLIYINEIPSAFWIGSLYGGVFHLCFTGYDPYYKKYELGTLLMMKMMDNLCDDGIGQLDFGFGEAFYKQRFGKKVCDECSLYIFAPTLKGVTLNAKRTVVCGAAYYIKKMIQRTGLEQKVKALWRRKLLKKI